MGRSRYRFGEAALPHFLTSTVVDRLPVSAGPESVHILLNIQELSGLRGNRVVSRRFSATAEF
jgi:hypothetical protein